MMIVRILHLLHLNPGGPQLYSDGPGGAAGSVDHIACKPSLTTNMLGHPIVSPFAMLYQCTDICSLEAAKYPIPSISNDKKANET